MSANLPGEKRREINRVSLRLLRKHQQAMVGHALRIENAVEMITFVLYDAGMKPGGFALDDPAVEPDAAIANAKMPRHHAAQSRHRQASLPAECALAAERFDRRIDQYREILFGIVGQIGQSAGQHLKDHQAARNVDLWRREP